MMRNQETKFVNLDCRNCGADRLEEVYQVRGVPTHSCLLMDT